MRIAKLKISNYRSIESLSLEPGPLTVLVGPNNCGKSNILAAVDLFLNGDLLADQEDYSSFADRERSIRIEIKFEDLDQELAAAVLGAAGSRKDISTGLSVTVAYERGTHLRSVTVPGLASRGSEEADRVMELILRRQSFVHIGAIRDASADCSLEEGSVLRKLLAVEFREERPRGKKKTIEQRFDELFDAARDQLGGVGRKIQKLAGEQTAIGALRLDATKGTLSGIFDDVSIVIEEPRGTDVAQAGTGWQSSVLIAMFRYLASAGRARAGSNPIFAVEEPEAYLHPGNQRKMMRALCDLCGSSQIFVSTHSTVAVDSIPWELFDGITRVTLNTPAGGARTPQTTTVQRAQLSASQRQVLQRNADVKGSEVFFASAALLVEGRSDKDVFLEVARKLGTDISALGVVILDVGGADHFGPALQLCSIYGVPWMLVCDGDAVRTEGKVLRSLGPVTAISDQDIKLVTRHANKRLSRANAATVVAQINRVTHKFGCHVLCADLEYALVNEASVRTVIETLSDKAIHGLGPAKRGRWLEALDVGELDSTLDEVRKYIGSKGLNGEWKGTSGGKKEHIPGRIAQRLPQGDITAELKEVVQALAKLASSQ
jgi:putative ATP-dependent endonuclease of OLD family